MIFCYILLGILLLPVLHLGFLLICSLAVDTNREYETDSKFYRFLINSATGIATKLLRIHIHTEGLEKIPADCKVLFVCNHRSNYDPILTWYVLRKWKIAFISKAENFHVPIFGRLIRKCCFMAIDRTNPRNAIVTIRKAAELLERQEVSIGVYPEGTRSKSCELLPFHNGVFKIAQKASAPIVVLAISGTEQIAKNLKKFRASHVFLTVADVIPAQQAKEMKTEAIGEQMRAELETILQQKEAHIHG